MSNLGFGSPMQSGMDYGAIRNRLASDMRNAMGGIDLTGAYGEKPDDKKKSGDPDPNNDPNDPNNPKNKGRWKWDPYTHKRVWIPDAYSMMQGNPMQQGLLPGMGMPNLNALPPGLLQQLMTMVR